jgi:hypothetical protein
MDTHLLDAVAAGATRRIVYVADTSCYGALGSRPVTEDEPPQPSAWGRRLAPALDRVDGYVAAGLPIVTALPGWVYGNGSWFRERVINNDPIRMHEFARTFARLASRPLRVWRVPAGATRLAIGSVLADHIRADAVFSNIRLRGIGFRFEYPTLEQGLRQLVGALRESHPPIEQNRAPL